jgi:hypothetical protein
MSNIQIFSLVMLCIVTGFVIGFIACSFSFKGLIEKYENAIITYASIVSSLTGKIFSCDETIENLTTECLKQKDKIDDLTVQIEEIKIIRLGIEASKDLTKNIELNMIIEDLECVKKSCEEALTNDWDRSDHGFEAMIELLENSIKGLSKN